MSDAPSFWRRAMLAVVVTAGVVIATMPVSRPASAHAELRQASPGVDETVGGMFHSVAMLFTGINPQATHQATLFDPAGNEIASGPNNEGQRLVLSIEPLTLAGTYTVEYTVHGIDGDISDESFRFRFDPDADPPEGITVAFDDGSGVDPITYALLLVAAAIGAALVHRFITALRDHRSAQTGLIERADPATAPEPTTAPEPKE